MKEKTSASSVKFKSLMFYFVLFSAFTFPLHMVLQETERERERERESFKLFCIFNLQCFTLLYCKFFLLFFFLAWKR